MSVAGERIRWAHWPVCRLGNSANQYWVAYLRSCGLTAFYVAARIGVDTLYPSLNDIACAADAGRDMNGMGGAIKGACAAFHTAIQVHEAGFLSRHLQHAMRANYRAHTATDTIIYVELQGRNAWNIFKVFHVILLNFTGGNRIY